MTHVCVFHSMAFIHGRFHAYLFLRFNLVLLAGKIGQHGWQ